MVVAMALFAAMAVAARAASAELPAAELVVVRFAIVTAGLLGLVAAGRARIRPVNLKLLALRGLFGGAAVLLYFVALGRCRDAGTAALLNNTSPLFTQVFAALFLGERPGVRLAAGSVAAATGVALTLSAPGAALPALGWGEAAGLLSAVLSGLAVVTIRAARATDDAPTILFAFSIAGLLLALPFAVPGWRGASAHAWGLAAVVGLTSLFAQLLMTHAFGLLSAGRGALFQQLTPVFTFALGVLVLHEPLLPHAAAGAALTLAAVAFAAWPAR